MMFTLILVGFLLRKKNILPDNAYKTMSKMETFIFVPALSLYNQMTKCTVETFMENSILIVYGFATVLCAIALAYPVSKLFIKNPTKDAILEYQRNIYKYALTFGNYGFMGNFIILGIWGSDFFYKYSLFTFGVGIFCTGWGMYILIPKDRNVNMWANLKKGLITPPMIALISGMAIGLSGLSKYVPDFLLSALQKRK